MSSFQSDRNEGEIDVQFLAFDIEGVASHLRRVVDSQDLQDNLVSSTNRTETLVFATDDMVDDEELVTATIIPILEEPVDESDVTESTTLLGHPPAYATGSSAPVNINEAPVQHFPLSFNGSDNQSESFSICGKSFGGASIFSNLDMEDILTTLNTDPNTHQIVFVTHPATDDGYETETETDVFLAFPNKETMETATEDKTILERLHVPLTLPSIPLPSDIEQATLTIEGEENKKNFILHIKRSMPLFGFLMTFAAMLMISSLGLITKSLSEKNVSEPLSGAWRSQSISACLVPLAFFQALFMTTRQIRDACNWTTMMDLSKASIGYSVWVVGFFVGLELTSVTHAYLLNTAVCLWIVFLKHFDKTATVKRWERIGALIALFGILFSVIGSTLLSESQTTKKMILSIVGDVVSFVSAIGGIYYLESGNRLKIHLPLFVYMLAIQFACAVFLSIYVACSSHVTFDNDPFIGLFGWLTGQWIFQGLFLGIVTGVLGVVMYVAALKMVPVVIVSGVMLLEPLTAGIMAMLAGYEKLDYVTVVGSIIVLVGVGIVTFATRTQKEDIVVNEFVSTNIPSLEPQGEEKEGQGEKEDDRLLTVKA